MKILIESFQKFPIFFNSCNFVIHEKSAFLKKIQKQRLPKKKIVWLSKITAIKKYPCIFIANEFFDALPVKQYVKKNDFWLEKFINFENNKKAFFFEKKINIKEIEKKINFKLSHNQNFIEYSKYGFYYLKEISKIIKENSGGLLLIDYGYTDKKMKNTLQGILNHKFANILDNIGNVDITHNINFYLFKMIAKQVNGLESKLTTQREFLLKMGIKERAEILSKNENFLKKADIFYRLNRLIDEKQMGKLFKVMLIKNQKNKFNIGF